MSARLLKRGGGVAAARAVGRARRHFRVRKTVFGTSERPRLVVTRSLRKIDQGESPDLLLRLLDRLGIGFSS